MILIPLRNIIFRVLWVFVLFFILRLSLHIIYFDEFSNAGIWEYLVGILFDGSSFVHLFSSYLLLEILAIWFRSDLLNKLSYYVYMLSAFIVIALNSIDLVYFSFTARRTTSDVLNFISKGNDMFRLLPAFFIDYWYFLIPITLLLFLTHLIYTYPQSGIKVKKLTFSIFSLLLIPTMIIVARGGLQLKPITVISASKYVKPSNTALTLNTTFTFFTTLFERTVSIPEYFDTIDESEDIYSPVRLITNPSSSQKNIVIIIVESLAREYMGCYGNPITYTPFLDSLAKKSIQFENAYANGKRSVEALPAVISGTPTLMQMPIIYSPYAANKIGGLPKTLKKHGYQTSFFHGGHNGTMGFEEYCLKVGFDKYYGMLNYPKKSDYDGNWGIFDEPFLQFMLKELSDMREPFLSSVFTLSSHHPYTIPKEHENKFNTGNLKIHETIGYADYSLRQFFKNAKKQKWYNNTLFIITADHTAQLKINNSSVGEYAIPLLMFEPSENKGKKINTITQQTDIYPIVVSKVVNNDTILSYGKNTLKNTNGIALSYKSGTYQLIQDSLVYSFDGEKMRSIFNYKKDKNLKKNLVNEINHSSTELKIKAIIDSYAKRMKTNTLFLE